MAAPSAQIADLAATAILGTARAGGSADGDGAASRLVRSAAILSTRQRAGWRARPTSEPIPACPVDARPVVNRACGASLGLLLSAPDAELLREWCELAAARGLRVPHALAPALLAWHARQPSTAPSVVAVLGERYEWLCTLNPVWRAAVRRSGTATLPDDCESAWQVAARDERLALLTTARRLDPPRAEALVRSTWKEDSADDRRRFVERCTEHLSARDEPFLERALDDRSKQVRAAAAALLARLPSSRFVDRMLDRAANMVRVERETKGLLRRTVETVVVEPPAAWDAAWERDGMEEKPPAGTGPRAWWLQQILSNVPPQRLAERLSLARDRLLSIMTACEYAQQALPALCAAAAQSRDAAWCGDLIRHAATDSASAAVDQIPHMLSALDAAAREGVCVELLRARRITWSQRHTLLSAMHDGWSRDFSAQLCTGLGKAQAPDAGDAWNVAAAIDLMARRLHPGECAAFVALVTAVHREHPPPAALKSIDRLRLRADLHREFTE